MNEDFLDMLRALSTYGARFLIVGAHALAGHGISRATGDLDIWVESSPANAERVWRALIEFGVPVAALDVHQYDFAERNNVVQIGLPPRRIDILTSATGIEFEDAWTSRIEIRVADVIVPLLGREALIANKQAVGRPQDLLDIEALARIKPLEPSQTK